MSNFVPTRFSTPVVPPRLATQVTSIPLVSPSGFRYAPTAISTYALVSPSNTQTADSLESLAQTLARATAWANEICYHSSEGSLAANIVTDADYFKIKPDGTVAIICNYKPIFEVLGIGLGPNPGAMMNLDSSSSSVITVESNIITLPPVGLNYGPAPSFGSWPSYNGKLYIAWQYVSGFPHTALATDVAVGATEIQLQPTDLLQSEVVGLDSNTVPMQMEIRDNANTETVFVSSINGLVATLSAPLQFSHTVPTAPDFIPVTAIPRSIEQAVISLTSILLKLRGMRAMVLPGAPGAQPSKEALGRAGMLSDYEVACKLLEPYVTVFRR